jgi:hypothetical protein
VQNIVRGWFSGTYQPTMTATVSGQPDTENPYIQNGNGSGTAYNYYSNPLPATGGSILLEFTD